MSNKTGRMSCARGVSLVGTISLCVTCVQPALGDVANFARFDVPGARLTRAWDVNNDGTVVGIFRDGGGVAHGFVRRPDGSFDTVDYPGAGETALLGINDDGVVVGRFKAVGVEHGFLLVEGAFRQVDPPGSVDTQCHGINAAGQIVGRFFDLKNDGNGGGSGHLHEHGFVLSGGAYQSIDYPDSATSDAWRITGAGEIIGDWSGSSAVGFGSERSGRIHGYTLYAGRFVAEDVPAAISTGSRDANALGQRIGIYTDSKFVQHGFLLDQGQYSSVDYPDASWTNANGMNDVGAVVGSYADASGAEHGFIAEVGND